jgi:hypothetical protein
MIMSFDERMLNGMGVLTAIVDSGSFAAAGSAECALPVTASPARQGAGILRLHRFIDWGYCISAAHLLT